LSFFSISKNFSRKFLTVVRTWANWIHSRVQVFQSNQQWLEETNHCSLLQRCTHHSISIEDKFIQTFR
jgi:hypothetical protein